MANITHISDLDVCIFQGFLSDKFTLPPIVSVLKPGLPRLECPRYLPAAVKLDLLYAAFIMDTRPSSWVLFFFLAITMNSKNMTLIKKSVFHADH